MKKQLLTALLSLASTIVFAQETKYFDLISTGFVSQADHSKNYIVEDFKEINKSDLYKKSLLYFTKQFVSPKDVLSLVENETITINAIDKSSVQMKFLYLKPKWDVNYTLTIEFKDGRVKVSAMNVNKISAMVGSNPPTIRSIDDFFNKKGEAKQKENIIAFEAYFNGKINDFFKQLRNSEKDNW